LKPEPLQGCAPTGLREKYEFSWNRRRTRGREESPDATESDEFRESLRNICFIMPGFESTYASQPFHPLFLQRLQNYKVLRFMLDFGVFWKQFSSPDLHMKPVDIRSIDPTPG
jgi:hypothetical protein